MCVSVTQEPLVALLQSLQNWSLQVFLRHFLHFAILILAQIEHPGN